MYRPLNQTILAIVLRDGRNNRQRKTDFEETLPLMPVDVSGKIKLFGFTTQRYRSVDTALTKFGAHNHIGLVIPCFRGNDAATRQDFITKKRIALNLPSIPNGRLVFQQFVRAKPHAIGNELTASLNILQR